MYFIIIFGLILFVLLFTKSKLVLHLMIIVGAIFMSLRGIDTPDTLPYLQWFENPPIGNNHVEQGYAYFCSFFNSLGFSFNTFLFILAFTEMEVWIYCSNKIFPRANKNLLLALCLSFYGIYFWGCVIRASIAITLAYVAMTFLLNERKCVAKRLIMFYTLIGVAFIFHKSSIIYVLCPLFLFRWSNYLRWAIVLGCIGLTYVLQSLGVGTIINSFIMSSEDLERFQTYASQEGETTLISLFWIISLAISLYITLYYKKLLTNGYGNELVKRYFINLYVIGFALLTLTINIPAGSRLGMMFTFFEFVIIYIIAMNVKTISIRYSIFFAYIFLRFSYMIHSFPLFLNY